MVRIEAVLDSWKTIRSDTAQAVEEFPAEAMDFRPVPDLMSFRENAMHILNAGNGLAGLLLDGVDNMAIPEFREMLKKHASPIGGEASPVELAAELRRAIEELNGKLAAQSPEFYAGMITRSDGQKVTRLEMLQMVKEHELTHRSQLFLFQRLKGLVPPTTRRRMAKK
jgi:uncharacterized damage-inducible protein DinB